MVNDSTRVGSGDGLSESGGVSHHALAADGGVDAEARSSEETLVKPINREDDTCCTRHSF